MVDVVFKHFLKMIVVFTRLNVDHCNFQAFSDGRTSIQALSSGRCDYRAVLVVRGVFKHFQVAFTLDRSIGPQDFKHFSNPCQGSSTS